MLAAVCAELSTPPPQEAEEYEAKVKEVQEEQAKYRKALELELKKLRTEVTMGIRQSKHGNVEKRRFRK